MKRTLCLTILLVMLNSCVVIDDHFFAPSYVNISQQSHVQHLVGRWLELQQDVFLFQFSDTKEYALQIPGICSFLPNSIVEYERDPLNWQNTDFNAQQGHGLAQGYLKLKVISVIPRGTKMYVSEVLEKQTPYESFMTVNAYLDHPQYQMPVDISLLLKMEYGEIMIPYPEEPELTLMGRRKIPHPRPGLIEYCEE